MTVNPNIPSIEELESFLVNNSDLDQISSYVNRFNPIRVMRMENMEIRHSAILAWLLDPNETHGFGVSFLKAFLGEALRGASDPEPSALDVICADLGDTEVQREKRHLDIFLYSPGNGWSFVIENKFHSRQSENQLVRYRKRAEADAQDSGKRLINRGIFLTLNDEMPNDETYLSLRYADLCTLLRGLLATRGPNTTSEVFQFLEHYLDVIEDAANMSDDRINLENLAKNLYSQHKKAIDFIIEHGKKTELSIATDNVFGEGRAAGAEVEIEGAVYMFQGSNDRIVSFLPLSWRDVLGGEGHKNQWVGCEKYYAQYPVICFFQLNRHEDGKKGSLFLYGEVGCLKDHDLRKKLIGCIETGASKRGLSDIQFRNDATREGAKYSKFLKNNNEKIKDISDAEEIAGAMRKLMKKFDSTFSEVSKCLAEFADACETFSNETLDT